MSATVTEPTVDGARRPGGDAASFVGSLVEADGSVTIMLRGRCDAETTERVGAHIDGAIARGARFLTVEIIAPFEAGPAVRELLGRAQTRLADRRGLLVVHGLRPQMLDAGGTGTRPAPSPTIGS